MDKEGNTPLHLAAKENNFKVFQLINEKADDINPKNYCDETPLHMAAMSNKISFSGGKQIVEFISENVTNKNPADRFGRTPLHNAALVGNFDMFQYIYENAKNKNPIDHDGDTPLHKAANGGGQFKHCEYWMRSCHHHKICQLILDNVENKTTENFDGKTPLQMATESNHSLVLDVLAPKDVKKTKANLNQRSCKSKRFKDK